MYTFVSVYILSFTHGVYFYKLLFNRVNFLKHVFTHTYILYIVACDHITRFIHLFQFTFFPVLMVYIFINYHCLTKLIS